MSPSHAEKGEVLKLGAPAAGDVVITVDPAATSAAFAAGTQALLPGAQMPAQRYLAYDTALFVHKGQGRVTLNERIMNVVPGSALYVPRGAWHGVRNTGTGLLQFAWVSSPGLEVFFRELSRLGASPSTEAVQELAQRHQIEFRPATDAAPMPADRHRRAHRGGRRHRGGRGAARPGSSGPTMTPPVPAPVGSASTTPMQPAPSSAPGRPGPHRRRHRGRRGGAARRPNPSAAPQTRRDAPAGTPSASPPVPGSSRPAPSRPRSAQPRRRRRGKEVYMDGRWVWVEEGGAVIAPGRQRSDRGGSKRDDDDTPPPIRLSVPL